MKTPVEFLWDALEHHGCNPRGQEHKFMACCPAHADRSPSLSCGENKDGWALVRCFAGCSTDQILEALGLQRKDLFPVTEGKDWKRSFRRKPIKAPPPRDPVDVVIDMFQLADVAWRAGLVLGQWRAQCPLHDSDYPVWLIDRRVDHGRESEPPFMFCAMGCSTDLIMSELKRISDDK